MARPVLLVALVALCSLSATAEGDILVYLQYPPDFIEEEYRDMPAVFGGSISSDGLRTFMVTGAPRDGCGPLTSPPAPLIPNFTGKWVVLLARYNCSFEVKVRNAQAAGFQGVIVHNVNSSKLEVMSAKNPDGIFIPSVFVSEDTGYMLDANFQYKDGYFLVINGDIPFNINTRLLVPFAIVVGLVFVIMSVFLVVKCVRERRRARRHRLPGSSLKKIPTAKFVKGDPYDICAICLDDYVEGDKLRVLPCSHAYHCKCIDPWLTKNRRVCPVCKRKVFASGERRPAHHSSSDSDTDDDRAPLISSGTGNRTQGGTFTPQSVNPFVLAQQSAPEGPPAAHLHQESEHSSGASTPTRHRGSAAPEAEGVPFLSGVLNLRRSDNGSSEEAPPSTSWCSASSHSGRLLPAPAPSQSPSPQPMIGVAALPNRDFIV